MVGAQTFGGPCTTTANAARVSRYRGRWVIPLSRIKIDKPDGFHLICRGCLIKGSETALRTESINVAVYNSNKIGLGEKTARCQFVA